MSDAEDAGGPASPEKSDLQARRFASRRPASEMRTTTAIGLIGASSYIALILSVLRSILVMRSIGPEGRGIQRLAGLYRSYLTNVSMPWRHGVSKELPLAIGADDSTRAAEVEDAGYFATSLFTAAAGIGLVAYAIFIAGGGWETRVALAVGGGLLLADDVASLYWNVLRSWGRFHILAVGELVRSVSQLLLMVGGAWALGVTGVMLGWLVSGLVLLAYLDLATRIRVSAQVNWSHVWRLLGVGLPVALVSLSDVLLRMIDGTVLVHFYGEEQFGLYSLAMQMATYLFALPRAAGFVIWPKVLQSYGAEDVIERKQRRVMLPTVGLAAVMPVIAGAAWLMLPMLVGLVVPRFLPAVPAAQILSIGAVFLALPLSTDAALVANDREAVVIGAKLAGAAVAGVGSYYVVTRSGSLRAVAAMACAGFATAALLSLWIKLYEFWPGRLRRIGELLVTLAPTAWVLGAIWLTGRILVVTGLSLSAIGGALAALVAFTIISSPCLIYAHHRTGIGTELSRWLRSRTGR